MTGVYLVANRKHGWYKIGLAGNIESRCRTLRASVPFELELIATWPNNRPINLERHLHQVFADRRINGEWFALSSDDVARLDSVVQEWTADQMRIARNLGFIEGQEYREPGKKHSLWYRGFVLGQHLFQHSGGLVESLHIVNFRQQLDRVQGIYERLTAFDSHRRITT